MDQSSSPGSGSESRSSTKALGGGSIPPGHVNARKPCGVFAALEPRQEREEGGLALAADAVVRPQVSQRRLREDAESRSAQDDRRLACGTAGCHDLLDRLDQEPRVPHVLVVDVADGDPDHLGRELPHCLPCCHDRDHGRSAGRGTGSRVRPACSRLPPRTAPTAAWACSPARCSGRSAVPSRPVALVG